MKKIRLYKTSFGWYWNGYEIRKSSIPGSYIVKSIWTRRKFKKPSLKAVRYWLNSIA